MAEDRGFARIESLDKLASDFLTAADRTGAAAALKAAAEKLGATQQAAGALYSKFAEKAATKVRSNSTDIIPQDERGNSVGALQSCFPVVAKLLQNFQGGKEVMHSTLMMRHIMCRNRVASEVCGRQGTVRPHRLTGSQFCGVHAQL